MLVEVKEQKLIIGACYRPPTFSASFVSELHDVTNLVLSRYPTLPLFLLGDFNIPNLAWDCDTPTMNPSSTLAKEFLEMCSVFSFSQLVKEPTRTTLSTSNTLDLILTTRPDLASDIAVLPGLSDHFILTFEIKLSRPKDKNKSKTIRDFKHANFDAINRDLCGFVDAFLIDFDNRSVQDNWDLFTNQVKALLDKYVPTRSIISNKSAPWYNNHIKRLSNKKKRVYRSAKRCPCDYHWNAHRLASDEYVSALRCAKQHFLEITLPSMLATDTKKFWRVINPRDDNVISLVDNAGDIIPSDQCASVLNDVFVSNFSSVTSVSPPLTHCHYSISMCPIIVDPCGVEHLINKLKLSSSPGCDAVSPKFLKSTSEYSAIILAKIFQQSLDTGSIPAEWKIGKVIPLHKTGSRQSPLNYRPISLTSIPCKLLEHILFSNLANFLESNSFFTHSQHGFRKTYSCETQLISFTHQLHAILDRSSLADCVFLDFSKAFDKVCHNLLMYKLHKLNLDPQLLTWLECFLSSRSQFVSANSVDSPSNVVSSGVPQGSVLGPLLFLIYINDLPSCITSHIHLFADDCVIFREVTSNHDTAILQSDLNAISSWCNTWRMELNISKCKSMRVSRRNNTLPAYHINNTPLDCVSSYKYLGVHVSSDLTWKTHIAHVISNTNRSLGYLRRNFSRAPQSLKLMLYKTLIRPKLEYAASVWDPSQSNLTYSVEMVQNNSTRFIFSNYNRTASITTMKSNLQLASLASRRKHLRLSLFHKIYHHPVLRNELLSAPHYISSRLDHQHKVGIPSCRSDSFLHSFIPRTSDDWNHLPATVASINDTNRFKQTLRDISV